MTFEELVVLRSIAQTRAENELSQVRFSCYMAFAQKFRQALCKHSFFFLTLKTFNNCAGIVVSFRF